MWRSRLTGRNETRAYLGLGGNIGEPAAAMAAALRRLDAHPQVRVVRVSALYRTPPWGIEDQPDFLNAVAEIETSLGVRGLLAACLQTERDLKRERRERWGPRTVDVDILLFGEERIAQEDLVVPHPRMLERAFVLVPLAEIAPGLLLDGETVDSHLARVDMSGVHRASADGSWWL
jgi:2-amino-4-hydroxy-6-hydroxymethyldihydropteridine diphosphokinase